jgi:tetratricopeptide (TPR) repeat protein
MNNVRLFTFTLILTSFVLHVTDATAVPRRDSLNARKYIQCMEMAREDPDAAFDWALDWRDAGGAEAARHCIGVALIGLKLYKEAGKRLEALAQEIKNDKKIQAGIFAQAAQARHLEGKLPQAIALLNTALQLSPSNLGFLVDRASVHAERGDYKAALSDLNVVLAKEPARIDALIFKATALRFTDKFSEAETVIVSALALDENNPDGLLERGTIRRLKGDKNGARRDWLKVLEIAPDYIAAETARANLEKMDLNADEGAKAFKNSPRLSSGR